MLHQKKKNYWKPNQLQLSNNHNTVQKWVQDCGHLYPVSSIIFSETLFIRVYLKKVMINSICLGSAKYFSYKNIALFEVRLSYYSIFWLIVFKLCRLMFSINLPSLNKIVSEEKVCKMFLQFFRWQNHI